MFLCLLCFKHICWIDHHIKLSPESKNTYSSKEEQSWEEHFIETHSRHEHDRYTIHLPLRNIRTCRWTITKLNKSKSNSLSFMFRPGLHFGIRPGGKINKYWISMCLFREFIWIKDVNRSSSLTAINLRNLPRCNYSAAPVV